jgi:Flp pilus assembly protein TadB
MGARAIVPVRDWVRRYAGSMYEQEQQPGGCRETLLLTRIAFQILAPGLLAIAGVILLVVFLFAALATHPALALIPVGLFGFALYGVYLLDKRRERERHRDIDDAYGDDPHQTRRRH